MHHYRSRLRWLTAMAWLWLLSAGCEIRDAADVPNANRGRPFEATDTDLLPEGTAAGRIVFESFERGWLASRAQQKPLLVFFTAGWCKFCRQMINETFTQDAVVRLSGSFVCVLVDADAEPQICREFEVHGFPTVQFVSPSGVRLNRVTGKQPAQQFIAQMNAALNTIARRPELAIRR